MSFADILFALTMGCVGINAMGQSEDYVLVWSDEFEGPNGTAPDPSKWTLDPATLNLGWDNQEQQYYTTDRNNAALDGQGHLVITAKRTTPEEASQLVQCLAPCGYTSARMKTESQFDFTYGKVDVRIQLPKGGKGIWSAAWMLGNDYGPAPWPYCGEIDVVAMRGSRPNTTLSALHGPGYSGSGALWNSLENSFPLSDDFHVFTVQWETQKITWFFDNRVYATKTPYDLPVDTKWVFDDRPFFILLNMVVGEAFDGNPDDSTPFPQVMKVDYIRVSQQK